MGVTHTGDERPFELEKIAEEELDQLREQVSKGELITVRDVMTKQKV
jgi:hypothetical protein